MKELDVVALTRDLPSHGLRAGDIGAIVHASQGSFEVEFVRADGKTLAVVSLGPADIRPLEGAEILHARKLASA
jgi:hypothetical protein